MVWKARIEATSQYGRHNTNTKPLDQGLVLEDLVPLTTDNGKNYRKF